MQVSQLRNVLARFAALHSRAGDVAMAKGLEQLGATLSPHDKLTVKAFAKDVAKRRAQRHGPSSSV